MWTEPREPTDRWSSCRPSTATATTGWDRIFRSGPPSRTLHGICRYVSLAPELPTRAAGEFGPGADEIINECFSSIKRCDLFVFLQARRHGSGVRFRTEDPTTSTYLEMELFAAALLRKPILILHEKGVKSERGLADLLRVLRESFGVRNYVEAGIRELVGRFREEVGALAVPRVSRYLDARHEDTGRDVSPSFAGHG